MEYLNIFTKIRESKNKGNERMSSLVKVESMPLEYNPEQVELLKNTVCKGASNDELKFFLYVCQKTGLDPFLKQIYSIPRGGMRTIQTSIDGLRLIADRSGKYAPSDKETIFQYDADESLLSAVVYVKKMTPDGTWHEVCAKALFKEYNPGNNTFWKKMPHVMLAKCAEALALRKAFPAEMAGIYIKEEMDQATVEPIEAKAETVVEVPLEQINEATSKFLKDKPEELHEHIRSYFKKYCDYWKVSIVKAIEIYADADKFSKDFANWMKKHHPEVDLQ